MYYFWIWTICIYNNKIHTRVFLLSIQSLLLLNVQRVEGKSCISSVLLTETLGYTVVNPLYRQSQYRGKRKTKEDILWILAKHIIYFRVNGASICPLGNFTEVITKIHIMLQKGGGYLQREQRSKQWAITEKNMLIF